MTHVHHCLKCGKSHVPKCDKCGATTDLRSYHGPCGKCAFSKTAMVLAFVDELEKISSKTKQAKFLANVGTKIITNTGKFLANRGAELKSLPSRLGQSVSALGTPLASMKRGLKYSLDPTSGGGNLGRGLFLAGSAASAGLAIPKKDYTGQGESRLTRGLRFAGGTATGLISAPFGAIPSTALGVAGDYAGGKVGRMIDKARGYKPPVAPVPVQKVPPQVTP